MSYTPDEIAAAFRRVKCSAQQFKESIHYSCLDEKTRICVNLSLLELESIKKESDIFKAVYDIVEHLQEGNVDAALLDARLCGFDNYDKYKSLLIRIGITNINPDILRQFSARL